MVELVDTTDLKSVDLRVVRVQVPLRVPSGRLQRCGLPFLVFSGRLRRPVQTLGAVYWVVTLKSIGPMTTNGSVFQFVAFRIKSVGV